MKRTIKRAAISVAVFAVLAVTSQAQAVSIAGEQAYGITGSSAGTDLVSFNTATPGSVTTIGALTGIVSGHSVRAVDFRPADGKLYALSASGANVQLYTVNLTTAALTPIGAGFTFSIVLPPSVSIDFNPVVDRLRVVSGNPSGGAAAESVSFRINPITGGLAARDTDTTYAAGDPNFGDFFIPTAVAYTNNVVGTTSTTLYGWEYAADSLVTIGSINGTPTSPNTGQGFTVFTYSPSFITENGATGFDISGATGNAYLSYQQYTGTNERLALINLTSGSTSVMGTFPVDMLDFSLVTAPPPSVDLAVAVTTTASSVRVGQTANFGVGVNNAGPDNSAATSLTLSLNAATSGMSVTAASGWTCGAAVQGASTTTVTCNAASLASGATAIFSVAVVTSDANGGHGLTLSATVAGNRVDPVPADNTDSATINVTSSANLRISLSGPTVQVRSGSPVPVYARLDNFGADAAFQPVVALSVAAPQSAVTLTAPTGWSCSNGSVFKAAPAVVEVTASFQCTYPAGSLPRSNVLFPMVITPTAAMGGTMVTFNATATSQTFDPVPANNSASFKLNVRASSSVAPVAPTIR